MADAIPAHHHGNIALILFNLGYLPGGDKTIITKTESTLAALNQSLTLLKPSAFLSIVVYSGHTGGDLEAQAINDWENTFPLLIPKLRPTIIQ